MLGQHFGDQLGRMGNQPNRRQQGEDLGHAPFGYPELIVHVNIALVVGGVIRQGQHPFHEPFGQAVDIVHWLSELAPGRVEFAGQLYRAIKGSVDQGKQQQYGNKSLQNQPVKLE